VLGYNECSDIELTNEDNGAAMLLAVDVGNTQTVLGLYNAGDLVDSWRVATRHADTTDEILVTLHGLLSLNSKYNYQIASVAVASVVPPLTEQWSQAALQLTSKPALIIDSTLDIGLEFKYPNPSEIGADRIADAIAAIELFGAPVIVVDFGTATNIEVIDKHGAFVGGVIAPGLNTSAEALFKAAARLPKIDIEIPKAVIGTDTRSAIQSGLTYGEIDRIDGLIERVFKELGYKTPVIATGGLSNKVTDISKTITNVDDNLTLEGLCLIYQRLSDKS
jgi:type III pantothenate kinase